MSNFLHVTYRAARRIAIAVIGATVVLAGIAMLVLPGPGILTIIGGLMVLGVEFAFARRWVDRIKKKGRPGGRLRPSPRGPIGTPADPAAGFLTH
jgi:drug/metabolite transporter (DMT)-like permease